MKFVSSKTLVDHARDLYEAQRDVARLRRKLREAEEKAKDLAEFITSRKGESFQFADAEGMLMQATRTDVDRTDVDDDKVYAFYEKMSKRDGRKYKVPLKHSTYTRLSVDYVTE